MSASAPRQKRVPPARRAPIRNPLVPPRKASASDVGDGPVVDESLHGTSPYTSSSAKGPLERGIRTAYDVIEEYMRRGYEAAGNNQHQSDMRGQMNYNRTNYNSWQNPWGPMGMLTEQWLMAMRTWTDVMSAFVSGCPPQQAWNPAGTCRPNEATVPTVSVEVTSQRPTEVTANLSPCADVIELAADSLQAAGFDAPPIKHVSIVREPGRVRVRVRVAADQPAGCYRGAIRNKADTCIVGELTVRINEPRRDTE